MKITSWAGYENRAGLSAPPCRGSQITRKAGLKGPPYTRGHNEIGRAVPARLSYEEIAPAPYEAWGLQTNNEPNILANNICNV